MQCQRQLIDIPVSNFPSVILTNGAKIESNESNLFTFAAYQAATASSRGILHVVTKRDAGFAGNNQSLNELCK